VNIFDIINGIAFQKKSELLDNIEAEGAIQPFLVNRWLSMLDPSAAIIVNETVNKFHSVFGDKASYYKFLVNVLPQYKRQRIQYIKKPAKTESVD
jgi:hypothetical protein